MRESKYLKANEENLKKLLAIPVLKQFETKDLEGLLRLSKVRQYEAGERIIAEGEVEKKIYFLISGKVRISKAGEDISTLQRTGDLFGEMGAIAKTDRSASVHALTNTTCLTISTEYIDRLSDKDKIAFCYILYRGIAGILVERIRKTDADLAEAKVEISRLKRLASTT